MAMNSKLALILTTAVRQLHYYCITYFSFNVLYVLLRVAEFRDRGRPAEGRVPHQLTNFLDHCRFSIFLIIDDVDPKSLEGLC